MLDVQGGKGVRKFNLLPDVLCEWPLFAINFNKEHCYKNFTKEVIFNKYKTFWKNSKLYENTAPCGRRVSTQFLVFPISTRVDITVYQYG